MSSHALYFKYGGDGTVCVFAVHPPQQLVDDEREMRGPSLPSDGPLHSHTFYVGIASLSPRLANVRDQLACATTCALPMSGHSSGETPTNRGVAGTAPFMSPEMLRGQGCLWALRASHGGDH
eukprot:781538-Amphidinium_carterae.2